MRFLSGLFLVAAILIGAIAGVDWVDVTMKGGSIGIGSSAYAGTNFLMSIACGIVAAVFALLDVSGRLTPKQSEKVIVTETLPA